MTGECAHSPCDGVPITTGSVGTATWSSFPELPWCALWHWWLAGPEWIVGIAGRLPQLALCWPDEGDNAANGIYVKLRKAYDAERSETP
jgi:hypothetical protein